MTLPKEAPIGVFDSGVGGLTVIQEMLEQLPGESFIYYADTAHVPYGPRDPLELKGFAHNISHFLVEKGCKMIVVACNTSTSLAFEELKERFSVPVIGVIEPGVDKALESTANGKIGIIATLATVNSGAFQRMIREKNLRAEAFAVSCPRLVPLIEEGRFEGEEVEQAVNGYLQDLIAQGIDSLVLACTHYPFLLPVIERAVGPEVKIINPARETVSRARQSLEANGLVNEGVIPEYTFYTSGDPEKFRLLAGKLLGRELGSVKRTEAFDGRS